MRSLTALVLAATAAVPVPAPAQESGSYRVREAVVASGGSTAVAAPSSPSFRVARSVVGEASLTAPLVSASYRGEGGFLAAYPPAGEVSGVGWADRARLAWSPERSAGTYRVDRGGLADLRAGVGGDCLAGGLEGTELVEPSVPQPGAGYAYLVRAMNRLGETGTPGTASDGSERPPAAPCP